MNQDQKAKSQKKKSSDRNEKVQKMMESQKEQMRLTQNKNMGSIDIYDSNDDYTEPEFMMISEPTDLTMASQDFIQKEIKRQLDQVT